MNEKKLKTLKLFTCGACTLMYLAGLIMFFMKNFSGGLSAVVLSTLAGLSALAYFRRRELNAQERKHGADAPKKGE